MTNLPRRISNYQVTRGSDAAVAAEIATDKRQGILQGVDVDFRHPDLPEGWWARPFWYVWGLPPASAGLIFPDEATHTLDELRKAKGDMADAAPVYAREGDRLTVSRVEVVNEARFMCHPHDALAYDAFLTLTRTSGETLSDIGPVRFHGSTRLRGGASREAFDNAMRRIADLQGYWVLPELEPVPRWDDGPDTVARWHGSVAHRCYSNLLEGIDRSDGRMRASLNSLSNSAMMAGYALAVHEMRKAEHDAAVRESNRQRATMARTDSDREVCAKAIWAEKAWLTVHAVAKQMMESWPEKFGDKDISSLQKSIKRFKP